MKLTDDQWTLVIESLEYEARVEAGMSQAPHLFDKKDTDQWELAQDLRSRFIIKQAVAQRARDRITRFDTNKSGAQTRQARSLKALEDGN